MPELKLTRRQTLLMGATALAAMAMPAVARAQAKTDLVMLDYQTGSNGAALDKFVAQFMKANPDVSITRQTVPQNQYQNTLLQRAAAGQPADILDIDGPMTPGLADAGVLSPVDKFVDFDVDKTFFKGPLSTARWKGKLYGLPVGNNAEVLAYNKKLLAAAGVAVPTTQDELKAAGKKLTGNGVFGFATSAYGGEECTWNWLPYLWGRGGSLDDLQSQAAIDSLDFYAGLVKDGIAPAAQLSWQTGDIEPRLVNGQIAMAMLGSWQLTTLQQDAEKAGMEFGLAALPSAMQASDKPIVPFGGEVMAVGSASDDKAQAAWRFIKWVTSPEIIVPFDEQAAYVPASIPATAIFAKNPANALFATVSQELQSSRSRTDVLGSKYYDVSAKITTAIQQVMTGASDAKTALSAI
jgi:multiple sugar transport system substrate-binding protein